MRVSTTRSPARNVRPDAVVYGPDSVTRLHVYRRGFDEPLTDAAHGQPALTERAAALCRDALVPLALLTNGRFWVLVHARPGEATRHVHVTTTLGRQVRQAVELFVAELARLDRESHGMLLADVRKRNLYRGALTALLRLVFLLFAEEQRLLPVTDPIYASGYAVSTLYEQLEADRTLHGDEVADRRPAAWPRLLALFRAIHGGCEHPDLRLPACGGSLFDPAVHPWLVDARITDRVVRETLDALLVLRHKGKAAERLSYSRLGWSRSGTSTRASWSFLPRGARTVRGVDGQSRA
jgi:hypothetical protein